MKSIFKDSLTVGLSVGIITLLGKPTLEALSLPTDGWERYAVLFGFLVVFSGAWYFLFKRK
jgi:hypothetical protein